MSWKDNIPIEDLRRMTQENYDYHVQEIMEIGLAPYNERPSIHVICTLCIRFQAILLDGYHYGLWTYEEARTMVVWMSGLLGV